MPLLSQLIEKCLNNNEEARRALFKQYSGMIMTICRKFTTSVFEADDVFQETFIIIFKSLHQFDSNKGSFEGWIATIARNESIRWVRKNMKKQNVSFESDEPDVLNNTVEMDDSLSLEELLALLDKLPPGMRAVFVMYVIEGYDHNEIGKMLDISPGTSKSQLFKAKAHLIRMYESIHKIKGTI